MISYEWLIEVVQEYTDGCEEDIVDLDHADSFVEAQSTAATFVLEENQRVEIALTRNVGDDEEGLQDRQWAYLEDGVLPEEFDGGAKVPKKYLLEVQRVLQSGGTNILDQMECRRKEAVGSIIDDINVKSSLTLFRQKSRHFDFGAICGDANKPLRQAIMTGLNGGVKLPIAQCGVTVIRERFFVLAGAVEGCLAAREDVFREWANAQIL